MKENSCGSPEKPDNLAAYGPLLNLVSVIAVGLFVTIGIVTDTLTVNTLAALVKDAGIPGAVLVLWYMTNRSTQKILSRYHEDILEIRRMYENNVSLVKKYEKLADGLQEIVVLNTRKMSELCKDVSNNEFCPVLREQRGGISV